MFVWDRNEAYELLKKKELL